MSKSQAMDKIFAVHGKNTWLVLAVCIKEMDACLIRLEDSIKNQNMKNARSELHQMIGSTRILADPILESKVVLLQELVKKSLELSLVTQITFDIKMQLDSLFGDLMNRRPEYQLSILIKSEPVLSKIRKQLNQEIKFNCTYSTSVEDCLNQPTDDEPDLVIFEYDGNTAELEKLSDHLQSSYLFARILLMTDNHELKTHERISKYSNLMVFDLNHLNTKQWSEAIKTIINGRDYPLA